MVMMMMMMKNNTTHSSRCLIQSQMFDCRGQEILTPVQRAKAHRPRILEQPEKEFWLRGRVVILLAGMARSGMPSNVGGGLKVESPTMASHCRRGFSNEGSKHQRSCWWEEATWALNPDLANHAKCLWPEALKSQPLRGFQLAQVDYFTYNVVRGLRCQLIEPRAFAPKR